MARKKNTKETAKPAVEPSEIETGSAAADLVDETSEAVTASAESVAPEDAPEDLAEPSAPDSATLAETEEGQDAETLTEGGEGAAEDETNPSADAELVEGELTSPPEPDPVPQAAPVAPQVIEKRGPGFFPLVLGGLVAGAIGYAIPTYIAPPPAPETFDASRIDALESQIANLPTEAPDLSALDGLRSDVEALAGRVEAVETALASASAQTQAASASVAAVSDTDAIETLRAALGDLQAQVDALPAPGGSDAALESRVTALEDGLEALSQEAAAAETSAEDLAREAARNQIVLAMDSGLAFAEPLSVLGGDVPEALSSVADDGVPPVAALAADFPALARDALAIARRSEPMDGNPITAFLRRQTGARSLEPREGNDADAVLSRAEAALQSGDVSQALSEIAALPDEARAVMGDWIAQAQSRVDAQTALQDYLQTE